MNGFQTYDQWKTASPYDDKPDTEPKEGRINNIDELANRIGCDKSRISRVLFKSTQCGIVFNELHNENESLNAPYYSGVSVCGYAEGADAECLPIELIYPFTSEQFWNAVEQADEEGVELWHVWNR